MAMCFYVAAIASDLTLKTTVGLKLKGFAYCYTLTSYCTPSVWGSLMCNMESDYANKLCSLAGLHDGAWLPA